MFRDGRCVPGAGYCWRGEHTAKEADAAVHAEVETSSSELEIDRDSREPKTATADCRTSPLGVVATYLERGYLHYLQSETSLRSSSWLYDFLDWFFERIQVDERSEHDGNRLTEVNAELTARTAELDTARTEATTRAGERDAARSELVTRTGELDWACAEITARTAERFRARADLEIRMIERDAARTVVDARTVERETPLAEVAAMGGGRDEAHLELESRTGKRDAARSEAFARANERDRAHAEVVARMTERNATRADAARKELDAPTMELGTALAAQEALVGEQKALVPREVS